MDVELITENIYLPLTDQVQIQFLLCLTKFSTPQEKGE
jgi:hypothetical protein